MTVPAELSIQLFTFSAEAPKDWQNLIDLAVLADKAGIDRLVMSDHEVMGENLEAYGDPANGGASAARNPPGPTGIGSSPSPR